MRMHEDWKERVKKRMRMKIDAEKKNYINTNYEIYP